VWCVVAEGQQRRSACPREKHSSLSLGWRSQQKHIKLDMQRTAPCTSMYLHKFAPKLTILAQAERFATLR